MKRTYTPALIWNNTHCPKLLKNSGHTGGVPLLSLTRHIDVTALAIPTLERGCREATNVYERHQ